MTLQHITGLYINRSFRIHLAKEKEREDTSREIDHHKSPFLPSEKQRFRHRDADLPDRVISGLDLVNHGRGDAPFTRPQTLHNSEKTP